MLRYLPIAALMIASPALAQQAPAQPSQQALVTVLHQQVQGLTDDLTISDARYTDAQQQIAALQAQLSAAQKAAAQALPGKNAMAAQIDADADKIRTLQSQLTAAKKAERQTGNCSNTGNVGGDFSPACTNTGIMTTNQSGDNFCDGTPCAPTKK